MIRKTAVVEIRLVGDDLGAATAQMRTWLDRRKIRPDAFRESRCPGGLALHVDFALAGEAEMFAARFAGRVLGAPPAR